MLCFAHVTFLFVCLVLNVSRGCLCEFITSPGCILLSPNSPDQSRLVVCLFIVCLFIVRLFICIPRGAWSHLVTCISAQVEEAQAEGEKQVGELDKQEQENNDEREALLQQELEIFAAKLNASVRAPCLWPLF